MAGRSSVAEAAVVAGYSSSSHFAQRFRGTFGCLPSELLGGADLSDR
jgi:AraC-like DNA-binding protein